MNQQTDLFGEAVAPAVRRCDETRRRMTDERNRAIQARFRELYDKKRLRYDDCLQKLKAEFFIAHDFTVMRILRAAKK